MKPNNVSRDFVHLSQTISYSTDPIPYELLVILEHCLDDPRYKKSAIENLIAFGTIEEKIKEGLKNIVESKNEDYKHIQPIAAQIFEQVNNLISRNGFHTTLRM